MIGYHIEMPRCIFEMGVGCAFQIDMHDAKGVHPLNERCLIQTQQIKCVWFKFRR